MTTEKTPIEIAVEALEFYSDLSKYEGVSLGIAPINDDRGNKATKCLASIQDHIENVDGLKLHVAHHLATEMDNENFRLIERVIAHLASKGYLQTPPPAQGDRQRAMLKDRDLEALQDFLTLYPTWWYRLGYCDHSRDFTCAPQTKSPEIKYANPGNEFDTGFSCDHKGDFADAIYETMKDIKAALGGKDE